MSCYVNHLKGIVFPYVRSSHPPIHPCQDHHTQPASQRKGQRIEKSRKIIAVGEKEEKGSSLSQKDEEDIMELV